MDKIAQSTDIIRNHMVFAMGGSLIPVPIADTIAITGVQLDMIHQISKLYQVNYRDTYGKTVLVSFVGNSLSRSWASYLKTLPIIGPVLGTVSMAVFSGAMTFAIGEVYLMHLEKGGTLLDFEFKKYEGYFKERFKNGLLRASRLELPSSTNPTLTTRNNDLQDDALLNLQKLSELNELLEKGAISQDEFDAYKNKIFGEE